MKSENAKMPNDLDVRFLWVRNSFVLGEYPLFCGDHPSYTRYQMKSSTEKAMRLTMLLALCMTFAGGAMAQETTPVAPVNPTSPTTAMSQPVGTMSKSELKAQRKQQKRDEAAARANAKAAKAHASMVNAQAKSKDANDKALQAQEKAGQVTQDPNVPTPPLPTTPTTPQP